MSKVYVVILNWNQKSDTLACIQSLLRLRQAHEPLQIIVVDNGSLDGSQSAIRDTLPSIHLIESKRNLGCSGGRNVGWQYALSQGAEWVLFLDNDTEVLSGFLDQLLGTADLEPSIGILGPKITYYSEPTVIWQAGGEIDFDKGIAVEFYNGKHVSDVPNVPYDADFVPGCALMAKSCVFETIGGFEDDFFIYFEDIDWCARALREGYRVVVMPCSVVLHKVSQSLGGLDSPTKSYYMSRNQLLFVKRHVKGVRKWFALITAIIRTMKSSVDDIKRHNFKSAQTRWRGIYDFFKGHFGPFNQPTD